MMNDVTCMLPAASSTAPCYMFCCVSPADVICALCARRHAMISH